MNKREALRLMSEGENFLSFFAACRIAYAVSAGMLHGLLVPGRLRNIG
jgi:hypothetical protein